MLIKDKLDWIIPFVHGRKVLDLGCVRHSIEETEKPDWLHGVIRANAQTVLGVDYLEDAVARLRERGFSIVCANVETMDIGDRFQVIVAGDLIEHLNNFGLFLDRVRAHLSDDGIALITTPNPVNPLRFVSVLFRGEADANPEHTCWFTRQVLQQLVERYGLEISETAYVDDSYQYYSGWKWWPFVVLNWLLVRVRNQFAETLCVVVRKKQTNSKR
jgi:2-polyprenyl-3-methyl-5-hydroxy-6-metoxy-1,4-benzoquinol methylase